MDLAAILLRAAWAGLFAGGLGVLLTAPRGYLVATFVCGFAGILARDLLMAAGVNGNWATLIASAGLVSVTGAILRGRGASPVVLVCGVLPLGAATAMFNMIFNLLKLSFARPELRAGFAVDFLSNMARTFTVSLDIALGIAVGMVLARLARWDLTPTE